MTRPSLLVPLLLSLCWHQAHSQWIGTTGGPENQTVLVSAGDHTLYAGGWYFFVSTNHGDSWVIPDSALALGSVAVGDSAVFAGSTAGGLYRSTDEGLHWATADSGLSGSVTRVAVTGTRVFAGTFASGVFYSPNSGQDWTTAGSAISWVTALAVSETSLYAGTYFGQVYHSRDNGASWTPADSGLPSSPVNDLAILGTSIFAANGDGVFRTTLGDSHWTQVSGTGTSDLFTRGTHVFAGMGGGTFLSSDNGESWADISLGLPANYPVVSIASDSVYLYAGLYYGGVWKRPVSEILVSTKGIPGELPHEVSLQQNYPNPFNPTTTISFGLPSRSFVVLSVYDALGKEVSILLEEELSAGTYARQWNASGMASGVYFCRLSVSPSSGRMLVPTGRDGEAGLHIHAMKLLLLK
jgi:hypothetical protein